MKYLLSVLCFLSFSSLASAFTQGGVDDPLFYTSYELTLTYDDTNKTLLSPDSSMSGYRILQKEFIPTATTFESEFLGILIGPNEKEYRRFGIIKPKSHATGGEIVYMAPAPYHPSGERIDVYEGSVKLFTIDVTGSRLCVEDGMCHFAVGESEQNCPVDCEYVPPPPPTQSQQVTRPTTPVTPGALPPVVSTEAGASSALKNIHPLIFPAMFFLLGLVSFGVWLYLRKRARSL